MSGTTDQPSPTPETAAPRRLTLPERLDLNAAEELAEALEHLRENALELDASGVRHLSALCLQVLIAARRQWTQDGVGLSLVAPSGAFSAGLQRLGLSNDFFQEETA
ncbi:STAS domain-containing protein [Halodurantibacterium flavum]|uniref:STAS domain-containing protein n=1 Tax=Halodurantibacterium flavum TaxID=1382802 RepID=A0ABW4S5F8_9RHOB